MSQNTKLTQAKLDNIKTHLEMNNLLHRIECVEIVPDYYEDWYQAVFEVDGERLERGADFALQALQEVEDLRTKYGVDAFSAFIAMLSCPANVSGPRG